MDAIKKIKINLDKDIDQDIKAGKINELEIKYLGRKGIINTLLQKLKDLPQHSRKEYGLRLNELKKETELKIQQKKENFSLKTRKNAWVDVTLPGKKYPKGSLHPVSYAIEEISTIFERLGFVRVSYPEVEWEHFAFEVLNMPKGHPARDDFESMFIDAPPNPQYGKLVLTPHTSSGQIREMFRVKKPPIRMINIAKCYRRNWDTTHNPMFYQFEGLCIDKGINITHLKGTIDYFAKEFFGENREIRLRPHHFQFTEPSFETDISCGICLGKGEIDGKKCTVCKSGWLELGGSGIVHPNVLKAGGIDPDEYTGWAFGFGPERCLMMKIGLNDMRDLYSGDIRFLEQF